jgi:hypothetical protein
VDIPPASYYFSPISGAPARLAGPPGELAMPFVSPIEFRRLETGDIVVINRFSMPGHGDFRGRPAELLFSFERIFVPVVTAIFGDSFSQLQFLEVAVDLNGGNLWYERWPMNGPFPKGQSVSIDVSTLGSSR